MSDSKPLQINLDDYEDVDINDPENPELTDDDVARMRPLREVLPDLYERIVREGVALAPIERTRKAS